MRVFLLMISVHDYLVLLLWVCGRQMQARQEEKETSVPQSFLRTLHLKSPTRPNLLKFPLPLSSITLWNKPSTHWPFGDIIQTIAVCVGERELFFTTCLT
jgi:hypothetical protein